MNQTRRNFLKATVASAGIGVLPCTALADGHSNNSFKTETGEVKVQPIRHACIIMETPVGVIYVDPVGEPSLYASKPAADLIVMTHEHGDHFNADTLAALVGYAAIVKMGGWYG